MALRKESRSERVGVSPEHKGYLGSSEPSLKRERGKVYAVTPESLNVTRSLLAGAGPEEEAVSGAGVIQEGWGCP